MAFHRSPALASGITVSTKREMLLGLDRQVPRAQRYLVWWEVKSLAEATVHEALRSTAEGVLDCALLEAK